jgi:hypothetical protein
MSIAYPLRRQFWRQRDFVGEVDVLVVREFERPAIGEDEILRRL